MATSFDFASAIARCLAYPDEPSAALLTLTHDLFDLAQFQYPDRETLLGLQQRIAATPGAETPIALVYGGAIKIKGYVFEATQLPEIRGSSALLDWVNDLALPALWTQRVPMGGDAAQSHPLIVYASGGNILGFAPHQFGDELATGIERAYTEHTLTANSVAVSAPFRLLELRFGRAPLDYWVEQFETDWALPARQDALKRYYYYPDVDPPEVTAGEISATRWRFYNRKRFGELVTLLAARAARRRTDLSEPERPRSTALYRLDPWAAKCDSSDTRPAVYGKIIADEVSPREISEATARKRYVGQLLKEPAAQQERKTRWFREHFGVWDELHLLSERSWERLWTDYLTQNRDTPYARALKEMPNGVRPRPAEDVGEIAQASDPSRYIGLIYADGDNVGRLIATLQTPERYATTSRDLREAASSAVFAAFAEHLRPAFVRADNGERRLVHPFEILAIGGDDLLVIVPGSLALPLALSIATEFERDLASKEKLPAPSHALSTREVRGRYGATTSISAAGYTPGVGLSAGVLIAQENTPIFFLRGLVEELQKSAKEKAKAGANPRDGRAFYGGAVDFMVLKSVTSVSDSVGAFRRAALGAGSGRQLTARPYSWHEFAGLLDTVRAFKAARAPRSQLFRLRESLDAADAGIAASVMDYLYSRARVGTRFADTLVQSFEAPWYHSRLGTAGAPALPPWMPRAEPGAWETLWPDLLEVYDMVASPEVK